MNHPILTAWHEAAAADLPSSVSVWDAHTHTGADDPDGFTNSSEELLAALDAAGHAGAVFTTSADPKGYPAHNDRILAEAARAEGRLVPFLRVDPNDDSAIAETNRALDAGHRGIKLHPRSEGFRLDLPAVQEIARVAARRRVPLLIHAGRGMDPLGDTPIRLLDANPGLQIILAHCAISDLSTLAIESRTRPGLLFDTAWWNSTDLAALFSWVDASQILYASDTPYGSALWSSTLATRAAIQAGLVGPALGAVFGGNLHRVLAGEQATRIGVGVTAYVDPGLQRVASNLFGAISQTFSGAVPTQSLELALRAAETSPSPLDGLYAAIRTTVKAVAELQDTEPRQRLGLLFVACSAALTPAAGHPEL
jgi:predicted TIM-barrel fold metal-dependent hydrolase